MACTGTTNLTITVYSVCDMRLQLTGFSQLPSKLSRGRGRRVVKTAEEREH